MMSRLPSVSLVCRIALLEVERCSTCRSSVGAFGTGAGCISHRSPERVSRGLMGWLVGLLTTTRSTL